MRIRPSHSPTRTKAIGTLSTKCTGSRSAFVGIPFGTSGIPSAGLRGACPFLYSDILIRAAEIAYGKEPDYGVRAEKQPPQAKMLYHAFAGPERVRGYRVPPRIEPIDLEQEKARRARL